MLIFFYKFFNPACRINDLLFTCEERVASRTYIYGNLFFCRVCLDTITTGTGYHAGYIFRMDSFLHFQTSFYIASLIDSRNSLLFFVLCIRSTMNSICSMVFISDRSFLNIQRRFISNSVRSNSSFLVPDL